MKYPLPRCIPRRDLRRSLLAIISFALFTACTIEETPQHYIDRRDPLPDLIAASEEELMTRLRALPGALHDPADSTLFNVLRPAPETVVLPPDRVEAATGAAELARALRSVAGADSLSLASASLRVGANNGVSWFTAVYVSPSGTSAPILFSGAFVRSAGEWRLVQSHVSAGINRPGPTPLATPEPAAAAG